MRAVPLLALALSAACARSPGPSLVVRADDGVTSASGDLAAAVTVSPNRDGYRDAVVIHYRVDADSLVRFDVSRHGTAAWSASRRVAAGDHLFRWAPPARPMPAAYLVRVSDAAARATLVVHAQGVDAAAERASYRPGDTARLAVSTDARGVRVDVLRITGAAPTSRRNDWVQGKPMGPPFHVAWHGRDSDSRALPVPLGSWRSGVYFIRLRADDGRIGYVPFVLRPRRLGRSRVAVVIATTTWQAYNFYDSDGDGFGDTWYAGWRRHTTRMGRPYLNRGVPAHFMRYDVPFLRWAARRDLEADYLSDDDLASVGSGDRLARLYDFVVFPGHHEYVTAGEYAVVRRFRDLGGNLAWLSANNFFWKIVRRGSLIERVAQWRTLGRPEASLIGVQYHGNDGGQRRGPMVVSVPVEAPWLFAGTDLGEGDSFGSFGIEIDARASSSPLDTTVLASAPGLLGEGMTAEMTYYELRNGSKVFAAGAFTLAGLADSRIGAQMLDNLFARLEQP
jgi:hypothetical protein